VDLKTTKSGKNELDMEKLDPRIVKLDIEHKSGKLDT
jgi:hypothetical protein